MGTAKELGEAVFDMWTSECPGTVVGIADGTNPCACAHGYFWRMSQWASTSSRKEPLPYTSQTCALYRIGGASSNQCAELTSRILG